MLAHISKATPLSQADLNGNPVPGPSSLLLSILIPTASPVTLPSRVFSTLALSSIYSCDLLSCSLSLSFSFSLSLLLSFIAGAKGTATSWVTLTVYLSTLLFSLSFGSYLPLECITSSSVSFFHPVHTKDGERRRSDKRERERQQVKLVQFKHQAKSSVDFYFPLLP